MLSNNLIREVSCLIGQIADHHHGHDLPRARVFTVDKIFIRDKFFFLVMKLQAFEAQIYAIRDSF